MTIEAERIVVSGSSWLGSGLGSIESALYQLFSDATDEAIIVAYSIGNVVDVFFDQVLILLQRGVKVLIIVNRLTDQHPSARNALLKLLADYPRLMRLVSFVPRNDQSDLHAKIVLVDRKIALIGSANLSVRGLADNHELGIVIQGPAVPEVVRAIDRILASPMAKLIK